MEVGSYGSRSPTLQARARQAMSDNLSLDPKTTAVVLIEYQNDFTSDGGALHGAVADVMDSTGMLDNTVRLVAAARAAGATIMHAPITFATGYNEISAHPYGILKGVVDGNAFVKDSWGAAIVDVLAPQAGDIIVEGKRGLDTFASTNLDFILRSKGITTIVLGGFLTNCCVESTMRTGYENGYRVLTLKDCVAATSQASTTTPSPMTFPCSQCPSRPKQSSQRCRRPPVTQPDALRSGQRTPGTRSICPATGGFAEPAGGGNSAIHLEVTASDEPALGSHQEGPDVSDFGLESPPQLFSSGADVGACGEVLPRLDGVESGCC